MILLDSDPPAGPLQGILRADRWLFDRINQEWISSTGDTIFPFLREAEFWVPFYLFLLVFVTLNFGKRGWLWSFSLIMTVIISDLCSSHLMKQILFRLRPCQDISLADNIRVLASYCPVSSSFTSSHACNHFALATFIFMTLRHSSRWWSLAFVWAFLISYAQVYVGVHYPLDVLGGAILGIAIGYGTSRVFRFRFGTLHLPTYNHRHA
jgi:membrane-associated phospholipid phosphatase